MATRLRVFCIKREIDPLPMLIERLGGIGQALRMSQLVESVAACWPEPFALSPPCCRMLTYDEALLGKLAEYAIDHDRVRFDCASRDLLSENARERLWKKLLALHV